MVPWWWRSVASGHGSWQPERKDGAPNVREFWDWEANTTDRQAHDFARRRCLREKGRFLSSRPKCNEGREEEAGEVNTKKNLLTHS